MLKSTVIKGMFAAIALGLCSISYADGYKELGYKTYEQCVNDRFAACYEELTERKDCLGRDNRDSRQHCTDRVNENCDLRVRRFCTG